MMAADYGGFWIRFAAKFLDGLLAGCVAFGLAIPVVAMAGASGKPGVSDLIGSLVQFGMQGLMILYNTLMIWKFGATLGKKALGLRVVCADGSPVSFGRALGRAFAELLSGCFCYIGYIIAAFDEEKRALHDHICGTRVIVAGSGSPAPRPSGATPGPGAQPGGVWWDAR